MTIDTRPTITHRHTIDEVLTSYTDAEAAYRNGNYVVAAARAEIGSELQGSALIMLGAFHRGLAVLDSLPGKLSPRGSLVHAFALWETGDTPAAVKEMESLTAAHPEEPRYQAFLDILQRETLDVLLFANPFGRSVAAFRKASPLFRVRTVGFDQNCDIPITPDCDLVDVTQKALGRNPDLALSLTSYAIYHRDYARLPCPKIGFLTDHDYFIFNRNAFAANDLLLTNGPIEHFEVSRIYPRPCHTYYTLDLDYSIPHPEHREAPPKRFDVAISGSSFVPYMREKAQFVHALMDLPDDLSIRIIQGFLPGEAYHRFIGETRRMPMAVRFGDVLNTRIIEAVQLGCDGLNLQGNLWPELLELQSHTSPYHYDSLEQDIRQSLESRAEETVSPEQLAGIDRLLPPSPEREVRFLKYFAFLGSQSERVAPHAQVPQRCSGSTGIHLEIQDRSGPAIAKYHLDLIQHFNAANSAYDANKQLNARIYLVRAFPSPELIAATVTTGEQLVRQYPNHLAMRFNFARFLFHYGQPERAESHFKAIVDNANGWELREDEDDILNYHYHIEYFPYMRYTDNTLLKLIRQTGQANPKPYTEPAQIILSTACHYLAHQHYTRDEVLDAVDIASLGLGYCKDNYNLQAALVRICWKGYQETNNLEFLSILIDCFDHAVDGYPGFFRELAWYALQALTAMKDEARLIRLLVLWHRHCARVLWVEAAPLPPGHETDLCRNLMHYRTSMPGLINQHLEELAGLLKTLPNFQSDEKFTLPNHLELLFTNIAPPLLDGLANSNQLVEASANLSAYLSKLDLDNLPWLQDRLMDFYRSRLERHMTTAH